MRYLIGKNGPKLVRVSLSVTFMFTVIHIFGLIGTVVGGNSYPRAVNDDHEHLVKDVVYNYIYGIQKKLPGIIMSNYAPELGGSEGITRSNLQEIFGRMDNCASKPLVAISNLKVRALGECFEASCKVHWFLPVGDGKEYYRSYEDVVLVEKIHDKYVIRRGRITPYLVTLVANPHEFIATLNELENGARPSGN